MGKYNAKLDLRLQDSFESVGDICKVYNGKVEISGKGNSSFIFTTTQSSQFTRITLKLKSDGDETFEDVIHNTSVRFSSIPYSNGRCRRSNRDECQMKILRIDQFHVLNKFQRKGCGSKTLGVLFLWLKVCHPMITTCIVISPTSIGVPFYLALGALRQSCSGNLEFKI